MKQRTLVMTGDAASESLVLRAGARSLAVDLRGDGRTDLRVARARLRAVRVEAGAGNDVEVP